MTATVNEWLAAFPVEDAKAKITDLLEKRAAIDAEVARYQGLIEAAALATNGSAGHTNGQNGNGKVRGMDAVELVMGTRDGIWTRRQIYRDLVAQGLLAEGQTGRRTLGSIIFRMEKNGRIVRVGAVGEGRYKLPGVHQEVLATC